MSNVGYATISIIPSAKGFQAALGKEIGPSLSTIGAKGGKEAGSRFKSGFLGSMKGLGGPLAAMMGGAAIGGFLKGAVDQASDLQEVGSALKAVFGTGLGAVEKFGAGGAKALGMSKLEALKAAQSFGVYGKAAGLSDKANATFSTGLASLGTDLSSFYNTSPEEAIAAIGSGLRGEAEPLRKFGVLLDDATLRSAALKMGLIKTTKDALTPQQKVLAAQNVIMKQTAVAQGDFARTSGGLAGQQRILSASMTNLKGTIGSALLPAVTVITTKFGEFVNGINDGTGAGGKFAAIAKSVGSALAAAGVWIKEHATLVGSAAAAVGGIVAVMAVWSAATKTMAVVQAVLNAVMNANPISVVILAVAGLVAGLVYAYKTSDTFRTFVNNAFTQVKIGALKLALIAVGAFTSLSGAWMAAVGVIINGAVLAFGWIPGIGPKLHEAQGKFNGFKDTVNTTLAKVKSDLTVNLHTAQAEQAAASLLASVLAVNSALKANGTVKYGLNAVGHNALGTSHWAGGPTWVGERGPEIINLPRGSTVTPNNKIKSAPAAAPVTNVNFNAPVGWNADEVASRIASKQRDAYAVAGLSAVFA